MFYGKLWYKVIFHQHTTHRNVKLLHTKSLEIKDMFVKITIFESFFIFDGKLCEQRDEQWNFMKLYETLWAMGFPLVPTLANVFIYHFENIWLENFQSHFKPIFYRRLVDDKFSLSRWKIRKCLNTKHRNTKFTSKIEENGFAVK